MKRLLPLAALVAAGCTAGAPHDSASGVRGEAADFLESYQATWQGLVYASSEAEWASNTRIVPGDDSNAERTRAANEALAAFTGSVENIETARRLLERTQELDDVQVRQLEAVLYQAAAYPQTVPELVTARIAAEAAQTEQLYGFTYRLEGQELSTNDIDRMLREEADLERRLSVWEASKEVGAALRPGLVELQRLRNATVRDLGYPDYFGYQVSEYGMSTDEMMELVERVNRQLRPLYRELHTWARHTLAERYGQPVPDLLPAHWLPNRWGQDWGALVDVEGFDLGAGLADRDAEWLVRQAERFYVSLGFEPLPAVFWERSSLYPLPEGTPYKKNNHASAWHMDLARDVRSLMSVEPTAEWYETTHHELGHIYYYLSYATPQVPLLLREGADRAWHEAVGSLMGLAAMQPRFVEAVGLAEADGPRPDPMQMLLDEALNYVVFIPWSTGTMTRFEKELYADELPPERWNARWWELAARYQGIAPPAPRGEEWCDAATKTHINDDAAQYYDYALSFVLLFQLHDHIAREILGEDPHDTLYFGREDVGRFLASVLEPGATVGSRELLRRATGSQLSAQAMVDYFEPLRLWLVEANRGRTHTLPEL
jgi:peptidyl-dipeptidase A